MNTYKVLLFSLFSSLHLCAYEFEEARSYLSAGLGYSVNAARHEGMHPTPTAAMPLYLSLDYAIDKNFGAFATFAPQFSGSAISFLLRGGVKYWFSIPDTPYVPYVSLAATPAWLLPTNGYKSHLNFGISPGVGLNYFIFADFILGLHVNFNPSIALVNSESHFEFSVTSILDLSFPI